MVLPALLLVLAIALGAIGAAAAQLACADAARIGARALARGEQLERARVLTLDAAPGGAHVEFTTEDGMARVVVRSEVRLGPARTPAVGVGGSAAVPLEPGL